MDINDLGEARALDRYKSAADDLVTYLLTIGAEGVQSADPAVDAALTERLAELNAILVVVGVEVERRELLAS
jgi:hypothetical protein